jgi:cell division septation protein DedD
MPTLPRFVLLIGGVVLAACAAPPPTTSAPTPPEDVVTWRDSDGCWRALPKPGEPVNLTREMDDAGNIICPDLDGANAARVATLPQETLPPPVAASVPEDTPSATPPQPETEMAPTAPAIAPESEMAETATQSSPAPVARPARSIETTSAPQEPLAPGPSGRFVQVGAFGNPENVTRNQRNFDLAGIPTVTRDARAGTRRLTLLQLGPFPSTESAQTALEIAKAAGFADAFIVVID